MLTDELRAQVDAIWDTFWFGGLFSPMKVQEQIGYLLYIRRLDDALTLEGNKSLTWGTSIENRVFPAGKGDKGRSHEDLRWSRFMNFAPANMHKVVGCYRERNFRGLQS